VPGSFFQVGRVALYLYIRPLPSHFVVVFALSCVARFLAQSACFAFVDRGRSPSFVPYLAFIFNGSPIFFSADGAEAYGS
jgi:hypothetical protein